jgi:hypothetical protein
MTGDLRPGQGPAGPRVALSGQPTACHCEGWCPQMPGNTTWEATAADDLVCPDCANPEERTNSDAITLADNDER